MDWFVLIASGVLESVWALAIGASNGFRKWKPTVVFLVALAGSMAGLAFAMLTIPVGTAYAVWVGVGTIGAVIGAVLRREEKLNVVRAVLLVALIGGIVGLKLVAS